jgi:hypothetical protein
MSVQYSASPAVSLCLSPSFVVLTVTGWYSLLGLMGRKWYWVLGVKGCKWYWVLGVKGRKWHWVLGVKGHKLYWVLSSWDVKGTGYWASWGVPDGSPKRVLGRARALSAWYTDRSFWNGLMKRGMQQDWSWVSPALDYLELYYKAIKS